MMPGDVRRTSQDTHPAIVLYCVILLGWPDLEYLNGLTFGLPLSGCMDWPPFSGHAIPNRKF